MSYEIAGHLKPIFQPNERLKRVEGMVSRIHAFMEKNRLKPSQVTLVGMGISGTVLIGAISTIMANINIAIVRNKAVKPRHATYDNQKVNIVETNRPITKYIIVDDKIFLGNTCAEIRAAVSDEFPDAKLLAVLTHFDNDNCVGRSYIEKLESENVYVEDNFGAIQATSTTMNSVDDEVLAY